MWKGNGNSWVIGCRGALKINCEYTEVPSVGGLLSKRPLGVERIGLIKGIDQMEGVVTTYTDYNFDFIVRKGDMVG